MEDQLATGWGFNQLWLKPLSGDFEWVITQFPPGGFSRQFPSYSECLLPGDFIKSVNSLPLVDFHVENNLSEFEWENVLSPGNFHPMNIDDAEDI